jgi:uncharacterized protein (TIGR01244 family)
MLSRRTLIALGILLTASGLAAQSSKVSTENIDGVANLHRLETTVACAGAVKTDAIPAIKKLGFVSVVNLRQASEPGANIEEEAAAAKAVGLKYFSIPFNGNEPTTEAADKFIATITTRGVEPAFIHCAGGNRAAAMWYVKRMVVDHWTAERAWDEASALGMTSQKLREWGVEYANAHKR